VIIIHKLQLGYQNIPKVATSSLFEWLYQIVNNGRQNMSVATKGARKRIRKYFLGDSNGAVTVENTENALSLYQAYYRFAVTRDPVKRFLSMYSGRVVHQRELSRKAKSADKIAAAGLAFDPQINELIDQLDGYLKCSQEILHHARPMMDFLGPDLSVYNRLADISDIEYVIADIKAHWLRAGLCKLVERVPELGRKTHSGPKVGLEALSQASFEKLMDYYRDDYKMIPTVNLQAIKAEYVAARTALPTTALIVFPHITKKRQKFKRISNDDSLIAIKEKCRLVQKLKVNLPKAGPWPGKPFTLKGIVLLKQDVSADGLQLFVLDDNGERHCEWGLSSPKLAENFPDNSFATNARFKLEGVFANPENKVELYLQNNDNERHLLMQLKKRG
jgi:hypothetical protein